MPTLSFYRHGIQLTIGLLLFGVTLDLAAAQDLSAPLRQMNSSLNSLRHSSNNHESELRQMEEKFSNMETIVDGLRQQLDESSKGQNEQMLSSKGAIEAQISELELVSKGLVADLQQIKTHLSDSTALLTQYRQQLQGFEKLSSVQSRNIENLQAAVKSLMEILQPSDQKDLVENIYQVKSGDTLEKIALAQGTTIKALKELNALTTDRIRINQKLKLPVK
jgi:LysM repeat protein